MVASLLAWAQSLGPDAAWSERECAKALLEESAGVLDFDPDAAEAALQHEPGPDPKLPFPRTLVHMPEGSPVPYVCLAEAPGGRVVAGCVGPCDHEAEAAGLAMAAFVASWGRAFPGEDDLGRRPVRCAGAWEDAELEPLDGPLPDEVACSPRSQGPGEPRGPLSGPRRPPRRHGVRGHYRWQPTGHGRTELTRVWVSAHERGGGAAMTGERAPKGGGRVWHVTLACQTTPEPA